MQNVPVSHKVTLEEAKNLEELVTAAENGEIVLIQVNDNRLIQLVPYSEPKKPRQPGSAIGLITIADDFDDPLDDFAEYME